MLLQNQSLHNSHICFFNMINVAHAYVITNSSNCVLFSGLVDLEIENRNEKDEEPVRQIDEDSSRTPDRAGELDASWSRWRPKVAQVVPELQLRMREVITCHLL